MLSAHAAEWLARNGGLRQSPRTASCSSAAPQQRRESGGTFHTTAWFFADLRTYASTRVE